MFLAKFLLTAVTFNFFNTKFDKFWNFFLNAVYWWNKHYSKFQLIWKIRILFQRRFARVLSVHFQALILICVDFLGFRYAVMKGGWNYAPSLKLVRIMLKTSNLARKHTHKFHKIKFLVPRHTFSTRTPWYQHFFAKKQLFWQK